MKVDLQKLSKKQQNSIENTADYSRYIEKLQFLADGSFRRSEYREWRRKNNNKQCWEFSKNHERQDFLVWEKKTSSR